MRTSAFLYILFCVLWVSMVFLKWTVWIELGWEFLFIYTIILLPHLEKLYSFLMSEVEYHRLFLWGTNALKYIFIIIFLSILWWVFHLSLLILFLVCLFLFMAFFWLDSRFAFFFALLFLVFVPAFLLLPWQQTIAETLSVNAFYLLILGVAMRIKEHLTLNTLSSWTHETSKNT